MLLRLLGQLLKPAKKAEPGSSPLVEASPDALLRRGRALEKEGDLAAALDSYRACSTGGVKALEAQIAVANVLVDLWRMDEAVEAYAKAAAMAPDSAAVFSGLLFFSHFLPELDRQALFDLHRRFEARMAVPGYIPMYSTGRDIDPARRLRIGYVSHHFSRHSIGYFIEPVIACHDRSAFEVYCYYTHPKSDDTTQRISDGADIWRHVHDASDDALSRLIRDDAIDILVDLSGHTEGNRLGVFARKPAPLQMTWLGYPDTTGLRAIDYRITDAVADPSPDADAVHTERLIRLDEVFICYRPPEERLVPMPATDRTPVFGSFNALEKVNERVIAAWSEILRVVPQARLLIKANVLQFWDTVDRFRDCLERHGIASGRVELQPWAGNRADHLKMYSRVDIALDTFPYNGTTTTCEALWMGVPVVTLSGDRHASRVGATLLRTVGLPELVAASTEEYIDTAVALARDEGWRKSIAIGLRRKLESSPLADHARFTRTLERALRQAWSDWCTSRASD